MCECSEGAELATLRRQMSRDGGPEGVFPVGTCGGSYRHTLGWEQCAW